jgi:hypothetical protein
MKLDEILPSDSRKKLHDLGLRLLDIESKNLRGIIKRTRKERRASQCRRG